MKTNPTSLLALLCFALLGGCDPKAVGPNEYGFTLYLSPKEIALMRKSEEWSVKAVVNTKLSWRKGIRYKVYPQAGVVTLGADFVHEFGPSPDLRDLNGVSITDYEYHSKGIDGDNNSWLVFVRKQ